MTEQSIEHLPGCDLQHTRRQRCSTWVPDDPPRYAPTVRRSVGPRITFATDAPLLSHICVATLWISIGWTVICGTWFIVWAREFTDEESIALLVPMMFWFFGGGIIFAPALVAAVFIVLQALAGRRLSALAVLGLLLSASVLILWIVFALALAV
jgi:hypothetical protein